VFAPRSTLVLLAAAILSLGAGAASAQQVADTSFVNRLDHPTFASGQGPQVAIDGAHHDFHTADGRYWPFAELLRTDGYRVRGSNARLTSDALAGVDLLVIANALAAENEDGNDWVLPVASAFDSAEVAVVRDWVRDGGALLLIADHMPFPGAASDLAEAFGFHLMDGFLFAGPDLSEGTFDFAKPGATVPDGAFVAGTLADHAITRGSRADEAIPFVRTFTGEAFRIPSDAVSLLTLGAPSAVLFPTVAWQFSKLTPNTSAEGLSQGAVLRFGEGRVAMFGEAAMFTAQLAGPNRVPIGMNSPAAPHNKQFLLNLVHWLTGAAGMR
jgi:hypothetical protein